MTLGRRERGRKGEGKNADKKEIKIKRQNFSRKLVQLALVILQSSLPIASCLIFTYDWWNYSSYVATMKHLRLKAGTKVIRAEKGKEFGIFMIL